MSTAPLKDRVVSMTAKAIADENWDDAWASYHAHITGERIDIVAWISLYDFMYSEERKKMDNLITYGWLREEEGNVGVQMPIVLHAVVEKYSKT